MKYIFFILIIFLIGCNKIEIVPQPQQQQQDADFFKNKEASVSNGQDIKFNLNSDGKYTLILYDSTSSQVVSREKIAGKIGINSYKIYTRSLQSKYLYLLLKDSVGNQIGKTSIIIN